MTKISNVYITMQRVSNSYSSFAFFIEIGVKIYTDFYDICVENKTDNVDNL